ncbi:efflux transporter, outer membrane factor lipo, NodT family domain protein [Burkholderia pseudomallei]|nr:efflux transporter, outer membrane factor lipo, NodT family domain protein [Burkholderia pseudomallei]KGD34557.1 efflux transporter, outer membrane factor lipo, NodT family domain protein [Burkholderia pseudomallei]KGD37624.1 efflux transporter, outer membrane factor lipo, NodT family domain protein [Burkholderia pseudomallei]
MPHRSGSHDASRPTLYVLPTVRVVPRDAVPDDSALDARDSLAVSPSVGKYDARASATSARACRYAAAYCATVWFDALSLSISAFSCASS